MARLATNGALLRWCVEAERVTVMHTLARHARMAANDRVFPLEGVLIWATMAPRQLLAAAPGVLQQLLEAIGELTVTRSGALYPFFMMSITSVQLLAHVDPPRLRCALLLVPRVLAAAATYIMGAISIAGGSPFANRTAMVLPELALYAPGRGAAMIECEALIPLLVRWAVQTLSPPVEGDGTNVASSPSNQHVAVVAASLLPYAAREALRTGREVVPLALRKRAAQEGWRRLAANSDLPGLAAVGAQLAALASQSTVGSVSAAGAPTPFPTDAAARVEWVRRCWTCGCTYRQPFELRELLRKCVGYKVAAYCGSTCSAVGWAANHRSVCAGWHAYATAAVARVPGRCGWTHEIWTGWNGIWSKSTSGWVVGAAVEGWRGSKGAGIGCGGRLPAASGRGPTRDAEIGWGGGERGAHP